MTRHIGIVACSAEGASLCYRTLCTEAGDAFGRQGHPEISMHTPNFAAYVAALDAGDWDAVGALMLTSAGRLAACGADFLICPDNTIHQALPLIADRSPLPWLPITEVVAETARERGYRRVALTGTTWLVESDIYPRALEARGLEWRRPGEAERVAIGRIIMEELVRGRFNEAATQMVLAVIERLRDEEGCDAVLLGCTELPLIIGDDNTPVPALDSTRLLARAALARAAG